MFAPHPSWRPLLALCVTLLLASMPSACQDANENLPPDESLPYRADPSARMWLNSASWYPQDHVELDETITDLMQTHGATPRRRALGLIAPHAGITNSGAIAAAAYGRVEVPDLVILLAPKHHDEGANPAIWNEGPILIPGHALQTRTDVTEQLLDALGEDEVTADRSAFEAPNMHPYELQLPFLSTANPDVELVSLAFYDLSIKHFDAFDLERIERWGKAIAEIVRERRMRGEEVLIVASTDLVHRVPLEEQLEQDAILLDHIAALDIDGLYQTITEERLSMCGEIPVAILMQVALELGHDEADVVARGSSYESLMDAESVVGYGGAIIWEEDR